MRWHIEGRIRATIHAFTGINFSGVRHTVEIWPTGGRQGDAIDPTRLKCIGIIAPVGTRMILMTSSSETDWSHLPWRAVEIRAGAHFDSIDGRPAVQIPDLDFADDPSAMITDPDFQVTVPHADSLEAGSGWTYGRSGSILLKGNVRQIRIDQV